MIHLYFQHIDENSKSQMPIYARAQDLMHLLDLKKAGATDAILENAEVVKKSIFH